MVAIKLEYSRFLIQNLPFNSRPEVHFCHFECFGLRVETTPKTQERVLPVYYEVNLEFLFEFNRKHLAEA